MFIAKIVPLVSGVRVQAEMAQCQTGYDWVRVQSGSSDKGQSGVTAQRSDRFLGGTIEP